MKKQALLVMSKDVKRSIDGTTFRPCWLVLNGKEYCIINWGGDVSIEETYISKQGKLDTKYDTNELTIINLLDVINTL